MLLHVKQVRMKLRLRRALCTAQASKKYTYKRQTKINACKGKNQRVSFFQTWSLPPNCNQSQNHPNDKQNSSSVLPHFCSMLRTWCHVGDRMPTVWSMFGNMIVLVIFCRVFFLILLCASCWPPRGHVQWFGTKASTNAKKTNKGWKPKQTNKMWQPTFLVSRDPHRALYPVGRQNLKHNKLWTLFFGIGVGATVQHQIFIAGATARCCHGKLRNAGGDVGGPISCQQQTVTNLVPTIIEKNDRTTTKHKPQWPQPQQQTCWQQKIKI